MVDQLRIADLEQPCDQLEEHQLNMKIETNFLPRKSPETGGIGERLSIDIEVAADLVTRARRANANAHDFIVKGDHRAAASAAGQAMMLARQAEIVLLCALAAERAALTAVAEQPAPLEIPQ